MILVSYEWCEGQPVGMAEAERAFAEWERWKALAYWFRQWKYQDG